jgi:hypothetical protein
LHFYISRKKKGKEGSVRNGGFKTIIIQTGIVSAIQISPFLYLWRWCISPWYSHTDFLLKKTPREPPNEKHTIEKGFAMTINRKRTS